MTDLANNSLEYLTVESIRWATGYVRPRMPLEEKRAKHRVHQRQFTLRQRQRIKELQRDLRRYSLQLKLTEALQEAATLTAENKLIKETLSSHVVTTENKNVPTQVECDDSASDFVDPVVAESEEALILVMLDDLPDIHTIHVDSPCEAEAFTWSQDRESEQLVWRTSYSCDKLLETPRSSVPC